MIRPSIEFPSRTYAEVGGCIPVHPALGEVRVGRINCKELKG